MGIENEQARIEKILSFLIEQDDFHSDLFVRRLVSLEVDFVEIVSLLLQSDSEYLESIKAILHVVSDYYFKFKSAPSKQVIVNETRWKGIEANQRIIEILQRISPPNPSERLLSHFNLLVADLIVRATKTKIVKDLIPRMNRVASLNSLEDFSSQLNSVYNELGKLQNKFKKAGIASGDTSTLASMLVSSDLKREVSRGIPIGLAPYDKLFGGAKKSELIIFLARTGVGKTMFALFVIAKLISDCYRVYFLSKEMDWESVETRLLAHFTGIPILKIERRLYDDKEEAVIKDAISLLREIGKNLVFSSGFGIDTPEDLLDDVYKSKRFFGDSLPDIIVIDYLNLLSTSSKGSDKDSHWLRQAMVAQELKSIAQDIGIPIISLAQANVEARRGARVDDAGVYLAYSSYIANPADVILMFWNDENIPPMKPVFATDFGTPGIVHAKVVKGRNIGTGWEFSFEVEWSILSIKEAQTANMPTEF